MTASGHHSSMATCVEGLLAARATAGRIPLGPFLRAITDHVLVAAPGDRTELTHAHSGAATLAADRARSIGLIVGELVSNAVSYAHPAGVWGRIDVTSRSDCPAGTVWVEITDDGVGLPVSFDPMVDGGSGLTSVRSLADQLGATLHFSDGGVGLSVRLDVPAPAAPVSPLGEQ